MSCSSGCKTKDHKSYGECMRAKSLAATGLESTNPSFSRDANKAWDRELDRYEAAVKQGIQPASTKTPHIEAAVEMSQQLGMPFRADDPPTIVRDEDVNA